MSDTVSVEGFLKGRVGQRTAEGQRDRARALAFKRQLVEPARKLKNSAGFESALFFRPKRGCWALIGHTLRVSRLGSDASLFFLFGLFLLAPLLFLAFGHRQLLVRGTRDRCVTH